MSWIHVTKELVCFNFCFGDDW